MVSVKHLLRHSGFDSHPAHMIVSRSNSTAEGQPFKLMVVGSNPTGDTKTEYMLL